MAGADRILEKLFGSGAKARLLRLFVLNSEEVLDNDQLALRTRMKIPSLKKDLSLLLDIGFIKKASKIITVKLKSGKDAKKKVGGYLLDKTFPFYAEIAGLVASTAPAAREKLRQSLKGAGRVNLLVITGALLGHATPRVDIFIVGDKLQKARIDSLIKKVEIDVGRELLYALMPTEEFRYRFGLQDRFLRDIMATPHEFLINKLGIEQNLEVGKEGLRA